MQPSRPWRDRLPKAPFDPQAVKRQTNVGDVFDWIRLFNGLQAELPEPFAVIDVLDGDGADEACEALRALRRNPCFVRHADVDMSNNRMWNINPVLHQISEMTTPGTALDLGCGAGRDSVWLAANGWEVTAVDRLEGNMDCLRKLRAAYAPNDPIHWIQANLNDYKPETTYDLVLLHYCWDENYFRLAKRCVASGGYLSVIGHSEKNYRCFGHPDPSRILKPDRLDWEGYKVVLKNQQWSLDRHSEFLVAQRLTTQPA